MKLPTIPWIVLNYPYRVATYTAPTPRTWFGRTWYNVKRARWERERAELRAWRRVALQGAVCDVCGVSVNPETCFVQWSVDPSTRMRMVHSIRCEDHTNRWPDAWPVPRDI